MPYNTPQAVTAITSNPVRSRSDLVALLHSLIAPLASAQSSGGGRIKIGHTGTHFDTGAAEFEGYARALWGLTPLWAAEPDHPDFKEWRDKWVEGLKNGTDEQHEEYWGKVRDRDQRMVEMAALVSLRSVRSSRSVWLARVVYGEEGHISLAESGFDPAAVIGWPKSTLMTPRDCPFASPRTSSGDPSRTCKRRMSSGGC